jgi:hypothetical protein
MRLVIQGCTSMIKTSNIKTEIRTTSICSVSYVQTFTFPTLCPLLSVPQNVKIELSRAKSMECCSRREREGERERERERKFRARTEQQINYIITVIHEINQLIKILLNS